METTWNIGPKRVAGGGVLPERMAGLPLFTLKSHRVVTTRVRGYDPFSRGHGDSRY